MSDPQVTSPPVHVFTDEQFKQLLAKLTPGPGFVSKAETVVKTGADEVLANIKTLLVDAEGTVGHVHGAAKQFQADVKANRWAILFVILTVFNTVMILHPVLKGVGL